MNKIEPGPGWNLKSWCCWDGLIGFWLFGIAAVVASLMGVVL